jgi:surface protein
MPITTLDLSMFHTPYIERMDYFIASCTSLVEINISNWGSDLLEFNSSMISGCTSLKKLTMDNFNFGISSFSSWLWSSPNNIEELSLRGVNAKKATSVCYLFDNNSFNHLKKLDMTGFIFGPDMSNFFSYSKFPSVETLIIDDIDISNVTNMYYLFYNSNLSASDFAKLDVSNWDVSNVTNMSFMFSNYPNVTSLDLSGWDVSSVIDMSYMFYYSGIEEIDISNWDASSVQTTYDMFYYSSITTINAANFDAPSLQNIAYMFGNCQNLETLSITGWNAPIVNNASNMFNQTPKLKTIDITGWTLPLAASYMFSGSSAETIILDNLENIHLFGSFFGGASNTKKISCKNWVIPETFTHVFFRTMTGSSSIEEIDVTGWDLSNTTSIQGLFASSGSNGAGLKRIVGLNTWDTSNVTDISYMFQGLSSLESLDLSSFDTSSVTDTDDMFSGCTSLTTGYARTQADADVFNASSEKPAELTFVVQT